MFPGRKLAGGKETTVRDRKAGSQQLSFPGGQPGQFPRAGSVSGGPRFPAPTQKREATHPATHPSFPGDQPGLFPRAGSVLGRGKALDFQLPPSRQATHPAASLCSVYFINI